jgi:hypothetical protein
MCPDQRSPRHAGKHAACWVTDLSVHSATHLNAVARELTTIVPVGGTIVHGRYRARVHLEQAGRIRGRPLVARDHSADLGALLR